MPSVNFNTKEVAGMVGGVSVDQLKERIPMLGVDLVSIDETSIEMEVFPNRPDMLSVEGFARALRGFLGMEKGLKKYEIQRGSLVMHVDSSVNALRPFAVAAAVYNLQISEDFLVSIMNVQEKLHTTHGRNRVKVAIGVHDLDKVKSPFTFKAVRPSEISFTPLDMSSDMNLSEILRRPEGKGLRFYPRWMRFISYYCGL